MKRIIIFPNIQAIPGALLKKSKRSIRNNSGQAIIELLVTLAVAGIFLPGLITGLVASREGKAQQVQRLEATALMREGSEIVRVMRDNSWSNIATNGTFHPEVTGSDWTLVAGSETLDRFTRSIEISDVRRDAGGGIVTSGGIVDPSTKEIEITVSWGTPIPTSVSSTFYLGRFLDNTSYIDTTVADFEAGIHEGTTVIDDAGGEIVLGAGGGGSWCAPELTIQTVDLPKSGVANAITAIEGKAFAGTGDNASGVSYASIDISNDNPPLASVNGTFSGYKTNDIFGEENYAYLATDTNNREVVIVDLTSQSGGTFSEIGYFDAPGNGDGNAIYVDGNIGYVITGNTLRTFSLTSKSGPRSQIGSVTLSGNGSRVIVLDGYAYVSLSGATQMQIVQVSNDGATLSIVGQAQVAGLGGRDLFINSNSTRAYLATANFVSQNEFFIINIETKTGSRPTIGSYNSNGMNPNGVTVVPGNKAILVGTGGQEYQVIDISNETAPANCGGLNIDSGVNGVASILEADGDAYSYIITGDADAEFKVIEGGPGGSYSTEGTFESEIFDAGATVAYNRLTPNFVRPPSTTIDFQVAVGNAISGSCAGTTYSFIGPDGTENTFFSGEAPIPLLDNGAGYTNPGRCFKYKVFFETSDQFSSPIFHDISINYSP